MRATLLNEFRFISGILSPGLSERSAGIDISMSSRVAFMPRRWVNGEEKR